MEKGKKKEALLHLVIEVQRDGHQVNLLVVGVLCFVFFLQL